MQPKSKFKQTLIYLMNPGAFLKNNFDGLPWQFSIVISGLAFFLLFLQSGLDMYRANRIDASKVFILSMIGALFGVFAISILALLIHSIAKIGGYNKDAKTSIQLFALSYAASLIYLVLGLLFSLIFSWNTSVAFGVTGILWTMRPMMETIKSMFNKQEVVSVLVSSICGIFVITTWVLINTLTV